MLLSSCTNYYHAFESIFTFFTTWTISSSSGYCKVFLSNASAFYKLSDFLSIPFWMDSLLFSLYSIYYLVSIFLNSFLSIWVGSNLLCIKLYCFLSTFFWWVMNARCSGIIFCRMFNCLLISSWWSISTGSSSSYSAYSINSLLINWNSFVIFSASISSWNLSSSLNLESPLYVFYN